MIAYYCPDVRGFPPLEVGRTGDGHRMGVWAGGRIEPVGHTKMIHDVWMNSAPYLMVGPDGKRFADEHMPWWEINTLMRNLMQHAASPDDGRIFSIMDDDYYQQAQAWQQVDPSLTAKELIPDTVETMGENGSFALVHHGETIAELAEAMGVDAASLEATVERYNELVDLGSDEDFGKEAALFPHRQAAVPRGAARLQLGPLGHAGRPGGRWRQPRAEHRRRADRRPLCHRQHERSLLRRRRLPHELPGPLDRPRADHGLHRRPRRRGQGIGQRSAGAAGG